MADVEIDLLTDFGTQSIKEIRARRIYNEEPNNNGLLIESILSTLDLKAEDTFTTSVSGNIIVGATGHYDADLQLYWNISAGTSASISVGTDFYLDIAELYNVQANNLDINITDSANWNMGVSASMHTGTELRLDAGTILNLDAQDLDGTFTRAHIATGTSFNITTGTDLNVLSTQNIITNSSNTYLNATNAMDAAANDIHLHGTNDLCLTSDNVIGITASNHVFVSADNIYEITVGTSYKTTVLGEEEHTNLGNYILDVAKYIEIDSGATMVLEAENKLYIQSITDDICLTTNSGNIDMTGNNITLSPDNNVTLNSNDITLSALNNVLLDSNNSINITTPQLEAGITGPIGTNGGLVVDTGYFDITTGTTVKISGPSLEIAVDTFNINVSSLELCDGVFSGSTGSASAPTYTFCDNPNTGMYSSGQNNIAFSTNGTQAVVIDENQNVAFDTKVLFVDAINNRVGINTSNPQSRIQLDFDSADRLHIKSSTVGTTAGFMIGDTFNSATIPMLYNLLDGNMAAIGTRNNFPMDIRTNWISRIFVASAGNVGIGTTNPTQKLQVQGDALIQGGDLFLWDTNEKIASDGTNMFFHVGGAERVRFQSNGNVGIGTNNPGHRLHIYDTSAVFNPVRIQSTNTAAALQFHSSSNQIWEIQNYPDSHLAILDRNTNTQTISILTNGNVGIGSYIPTQKLDVDGDALIQGGDLYLVDTNEKIASDGTDMFFHVGGSEVVRFEAGGNVGVGTATPSSKHHVFGTSRVQVTDANAFVVEKETGEDCFVIDTTTCSTTTSGDLMVNGGDVTFTNDSDTALVVSGTTDACLIVDTINCEVTVAGLLTARNVLFDDLSVSNLGLAGDLNINNGDVTIINHSASTFVISGTTETCLSVDTINCEVNIDGLLNVNNLETHTIRGISGNLDLFSNLAITGVLSVCDSYIEIEQGSASEPSIRFCADSNTGIYQPSLENLSLVTNGVQRINIDENGNVGVGTGTPAYNLHVQNSAFIDGKLTIGDSGTPLSYTQFMINGNEAQMEFRRNSDYTLVGKINNTDSSFYIQQNGADGNLLIQNKTNGYMSFETNALERLRILSNGNIGIGTTNPTQKLHVQGNTRVTGVLTLKDSTDNSTNRVISHMDSSVTNDDYRVMVFGKAATLNNQAVFSYFHVSDGNSANSFRFGLFGDNDRIVIQGGGNVGIGTSAPTQKFHVNGDALIQGGDLYLVDTNEKIASDGTNMFFHVGGAERVRFQSNGNVGIGTNNPGHRLHIYDGSANFNPTKIQSGGSGAALQLQSSSNQIWEIQTYSNSLFAIRNRTDEFDPVNILTNGNVGIGTSNPTQKLQVQGDALIQGGDLYLVDTNEKIASNGTDMFFHVAGSEAVRFTAAGDVGVGTATPSSKHHVFGTSRVQVTDANAFVVEKATGEDCFVIDTTDCSVTLSGDLMVNANIGITSGNLTVNSGDVTITSQSTTALIVEGISGNDPCLAVDTENCIVTLGETNITSDLRLTSSSETGFVINTTNDGDCFIVNTVDCGVSIMGYLHVESINTETLNISGDLGVSGNLSVTGSLSVCNAQIIIDQGSASAPAIAFCGDQNTGIYQPSLEHLSFATNGIQRINIDNNGNVGIGTNNPTQTLHVVGASNFQTSSGLINIGTPWGLPGFTFNNDNLNNYARFDINNVSSPVDGWQVFRLGFNADIVSNNALYIRKGGNVGVGTQSPSQKLDVQGDALIRGGDLYLVDTNEKIASDGTNMFFHVGGVERVRFDSSGNVGMGTASPSDRLHVYGGDLRVQNNSTEAFVVEKLNGSDCFVIDTTTCTTTLSGPGIIKSSGTALSVRGADNVACFTINGDSCATGVSGNLTISQDSATAFVVQDKLQTECFVVDTLTCGVTISGLLTANNIHLENIVGDLGLLGNLSVTGNVEFCTAPVQFASGSAAAPSLTFCGDLNTGIFRPAADNLALATAGTERIRVLSNGNVGIGTTNPSSKLTINGDSIIKNNTDDTFLRILAGTDALYFQAGSELVSGSSKDIFFGNIFGNSINSTRKIIFKANGDIGVGTSTPLSKHHVLGTSRVQVTDANAFVIEKATGEDCFVVNTVDCSVTIDGPVHITSDSVRAFNVDNLDGTVLLNVDGLNDSVGITGDLYVHDYSTTAFVVEGITGEDCFVVDTVNCKTTVYGELQTLSLGVSGDMVVEGNLIVHGSQTILNTETLTVDDHAIELNGVTSPTDASATDGGIILHGDADYSIIWDSNCIQGSYGVTAAWSFNQNVNINDTLGYYIDCKVHHDQQNLLVNTRRDGHAGAFYLSSNDINVPVDGDWRIKTKTNALGVEELLFQRFDGSIWQTRTRMQ